MRCETSYFSLTLYRKLLSRYWPMWAGWFVLWLLAVPVQLWQAGRTDREEALRQITGLADLGGSVGALAGCMAIITAAGVFFYLFKSQAANLIGALPMRREGLFATAFLAGLTILVAPLAAVALLTLGVEALLGMVYIVPLLKVLGSAAIVSFFWMAFAALCCVISGNQVAAVVFFFIFNGVVAVMCLLLNALCELFFYGFGGFPEWVEDAIMWTTPFGNILAGEGSGPAWWEMMGVYAGVGFLMFLAALGLHHIRKAERAGDLIAFKPLRYVFKVCVILCGGVAFGSFFTTIAFHRLSEDTVGWPLTVCCCASAVMCAFVAEMLLRKSFRVWDSWKWAAASALAFALVLTGLNYDVIGYVRRVPAPESVARAYVTVNGQDLDPMAGEGLWYEGDALGALRDVHTLLAKGAGREGTVDHSNDPVHRTLEVRYALKSGFTLDRVYRVYVEPGSPLEKALDRMIPQGRPNFDVSLGVPNGAMWVEYDDGGKSTMSSSLKDYRERLWQAIVEDVEAGRYVPRAGKADRDVYIRLSWMDDPFAANSVAVKEQVFYCDETTTSVNAALAEIFPNGVDMNMSDGPATIATEIAD